MFVRPSGGVKDFSVYACEITSVSTPKLTGSPLKLLQTKEAIDAAADFPQFPAKRTNERHAYRPGKLNVLDVLADDLPVFRIQSLSATHGPAHRR